MDSISNGVASFAPALARRSTTAVEPRSLAKSIADLPSAFLALTSHPRAIRVLTDSTGSESELQASIRSVVPSGAFVFGSTPRATQLATAEASRLGGADNNAPMPRISGGTPALNTSIHFSHCAY